MGTDKFYLQNSIAHCHNAIASRAELNEYNEEKRQELAGIEGVTIA